MADARGRAIVDIEADDFVVRETGKPREVLSVRVADYPIAVVLDNGPGAGQDFDRDSPGGGALHRADRPPADRGGLVRSGRG